MKKTSLVLAISALLYGTSSVYVLADDVVLSDFITETGELIDSTVNLPAGFDDPQPLPKNVAVAGSDQPISVDWPLRMCNPSFAVNGPAMATFPVTVNGSDVGVWSDDGKTVTGNGWTLKLPVGDSWSSAWKLTVAEGVVTSILLEPFKRKNADQMRYAFDIGGKFPRFPAPRPPYEHTPDAARGQFIIQRTPSEPKPIFTATYSYPIYTTANMIPDGTGYHDWPNDSVDIPLDDSSIDRLPTHDLYSTLEINFMSEFTELLIDPGFGFVADTDCLPVSEVAINSYENGVLNFTVVGEGAVAIMDAQKLVQGPFMVERGTGQATFTTQFVPTAGSCYNMMDVDTLKVMTKDYCF